MIVGVGIDVVEIDRFTDRLTANARLGERLFTQEELGLRPESMAARFAAKEAVRWRELGVDVEAARTQRSRHDRVADGAGQAKFKSRIN